MRAPHASTLDDQRRTAGDKSFAWSAPGRTGSIVPVSPRVNPRITGTHGAHQTGRLNGSPARARVGSGRLNAHHKHTPIYD